MSKLQQTVESLTISNDILREEQRSLQVELDRVREVRGRHSTAEFACQADCVMQECSTAQRAAEEFELELRRLREDAAVQNQRQQQESERLCR